MPEPNDQIFVKSHVARDLLQNAALFKTDKLVVWEYVSNSLQYTDPGTNPVVKVTLDSKRRRIAIADNGRGMDWAGLQNFFIMHGENLDRKEGRAGRGRFGTGKSAALGIGDLLRVTTVRNSRLSVVELRREDVQRMGSEAPIPVRTLEKEILTKAINGTLIEIEGIHLKSLDQPGVIHYIERHLARWPKTATVFVNNHQCEFAEPSISRTLQFIPEGPQLDRLGPVQLTLKVAKAPLEEDLRGVSIFANGVWHETTLAGSDGREMSQYLFGEIDVPRLDEDESPISPFDLSRSMRLNPSNDLVQAVYSFVGQKIDEVRRQLVEAEKKRRRTEEENKLAEQASEIARLLNEDFDAFRQRVARTKAVGVGGSDAFPAGRSNGDESDDLFAGSVVPAVEHAPTGGPGSEGGARSGGQEPRALGPGLRRSPGPTDRTGAPPQRTDKVKPRGGFSVRFGHMGAELYRAQYVRDERTIFINLDHPQISAAVGLGTVEDPTFRRLANEVAFAEYAIALASELAARDEYVDPSDPIVDIRETLNRLATRAAFLYSA